MTLYLHKRTGQIVTKIPEAKSPLPFHQVAGDYDEITHDLPPDPEGTNVQRSNRGAALVTAYKVMAGDDDESVLTDLLADLMHWADFHGEDWCETLLRSVMHHAAETMPETTHQAEIQQECDAARDTGQ